MGYMNKLKLSRRLFLLVTSFYLVSCSTIESTIDSAVDSISNAGDYIYDSVNFWDDETDEPEQSEAIIIEEAVEVPDYAIPDQNFMTQEIPQQNPPIPSLTQPQPYYDPIYRSARQYYFVGPNGTPMLAPPPFPQYSIDQANPVVPYSYYNSLNSIPNQQIPNQSTQALEQPTKKIITKNV